VKKIATKQKVNWPRAAAVAGSRTATVSTQQ